jgi:endonuclease/exonuclease/phosphatase (EEP) superfamily protein YafD
MKVSSKLARNNYSMRRHIAKTIQLSTKAAAVALVFCYLSLFAAQWATPLNLITPFAFQYTVGGAVLCIILAFFRQKNWAMGAVILTLLLGGEYVRANNLLTPMDSLGESGYTLNVISFNQLRHNDKAGEFLRRDTVMQSDLIVILEANKVSAAQAAKMKDQFPHQFYALGLSSKSMIILSRWPMLNIDRIQMFDSDLAKNFIVKFQIQPAPPYAPLQLYALHTKAPIPYRRIKERNAELKYLAQLIASDHQTAPSTPQMAMGDFNITPYNPHFKKLLVQSKLRSPAPYALPAHSWPSFAPWFLRFQIDHILVSQGITPLTVKTLKGTGSDHLALHGRFHISSTNSY